MNFLKKGPEIRLSEIKVPGFAQDVYYDLKERHLLPLAAVLLLAIVVVPFALSRSSSAGGTDEAGASGAAAVAATAQSSSSGAEQLVAKSAPGLRDYRRRLDHLKSKNPFRQQYARGGSEGGESGGGGSSAESGGEASTTATETTSTEETAHEIGSGGSGSSEGNTPGTGEGTWYSYAIDVKVTTGAAEGNRLGVGDNRLSIDGVPGGGGALASAGAKGDRKVRVRRNLPELTMLPSREAPALTYMGSTKDGKKALMLISSDVSALFGDAKCVIGSSTCQLLALEVGLPETVVYGGNNRTFKVELLQIHLVKTKKLNRAPIGKPHKHREG